MYTVQQIITAMTPGHPGFVALIIGFGIANAIGLLEYIWAVALTFKEKAGPFPMWMHAFFFAHDTTAGVIFTLLAFRHHFFWLFTIYALGMLTWAILELVCITMELKYNASAEFNRALPGAIVQTVFLILINFCIVNLFRYLDHDVAMFIWLPLTNFVMAIGPGYTLLKRNSRQGSSVMLYIFVVLGTLFNFAPKGIGFFTSIVPQIYNTPLYYFAGVVATVIAVYNLYQLLRLPAKAKGAIW
ncbi:hypothetical protein [Limosilactobacillus sp.]|jgi:hypothetical protein|uniref:hypothetical protein n=1 Tax=Limosilactobacillus sp. TaxID=2773925 RepID=UPI0025C3CD5F|nr:hypothetical protein [Limosilactobacillus sp.]MCH3922040.1 hypothetical protein [Limosilactobacillus sp.]MCH3928811.1 hypothetical protein [Limosilactobacillus sp.]